MNTQVVQSFLIKFVLVSTCIYSSVAQVNADNYLLLQGLYPWDSVPDNSLSQSRGGFVFSNGIEVDVGIRRNLSVSDTGADLSGDFIGSLNSPEYVSTSISLSSGTTIIRNSLDNLSIRNTTLLDIHMRNIDSFKKPQELIPDFYVPIEPTVFE